MHSQNTWKLANKYLLQLEAKEIFLTASDLYPFPEDCFAFLSFQKMLKVGHNCTCSQGGRSCAGARGLDSDENFKREYTLFCRELRFVAIHALFLEIFGHKKCIS